MAWVLSGGRVGGESTGHQGLLIDAESVQVVEEPGVVREGMGVAGHAQVEEEGFRWSGRLHGEENGVKVLHHANSGC